MARPAIARALLTLLGLALGAVAGSVLTFLGAASALPGCGARSPGETCDAPGYVALGLALFVGAPLGAALGARGGQRLARRLTRRCS